MDRCGSLMMNEVRFGVDRNAGGDMFRESCHLVAQKIIGDSLT